MSVKFEDKSWVELKKYIDNEGLILVPIGAIEEHGPHLPVSTDMVIGRELAKAVAENIKDKIPVLVTPDMWQSYNGEFIRKNWPGSLTVSQDTQKAILLDITENIIKMGFKNIIYINSHGQNLFTMEAVIRLIADKYNIHIPYIFEYKISENFIKENRKSEIGGICHACEYETSLMLYLTDLVDMSKAEKNLATYDSKFRNTDGVQGKSKAYWSTWALEKTKSGVLGDPTVATKEMGEKLFNHLVKEISEFVFEFYEFNKKND
jgi:creatinine amidohydrolase